MSEAEVTLEALDARLAAAAGELLKVFLNAAQARADTGLAEQIAALGEARLLIHARGDTLQVDLLAPGPAGSTVCMLALTAMAEEERPCWIN